jgi:hypothetical protein
MSGAAVRQYKLTLSAEGTAELLADAVTVWASDTDPDLADDLGTDAVTDDDLADVLDYLVDTGRMSDDEADDCLIESFEPDDDAPAEPDEPDNEEVV